MSTLPDALLDDPFLNDAFDFSRYPTFKTRNTKPLTRSELRHRTRGRTALFASVRGSPSGLQRSRNVSEPQLISSTNYMRESWFTGFASARTVADIANLSSNDEILPIVHRSQTTTDTCEALSDRSCRDVDADQSQSTLLAVYEDSCETTGSAESSEYKGEDESFYSVDSADQDAHPFLLSMPIIPQIKLERKATVRKPDPTPLSEATQHQSLLSPRMRDLRTPARMSSRRYGRILARTGPLAVAINAVQDRSHVHGTLSCGAFQELGAELACTHSASEPLLNSAYPPGDEETLESPHSDVLLSMIDEVGSSPGPHNECQESGIDDPPRQKQVPSKHFKRSHQRSSVNHSISLSSIVHAVADGCASLDLLRKPKTKPKATTKPKPRERSPNPHDPTSKWAPEQGRIIIKVFVPSTDDIWMFRVPQDIGLTDFTSRVVGKLGFSVSFSGSLWDEPKYYFRTDDRFKSWVKGRVRFGRNLPVVAHVPPRLPLVRLGVDGVGCEVWCYA